jgi:hypothetical protein
MRDPLVMARCIKCQKVDDKKNGKWGEEPVPNKPKMMIFVWTCNECLEEAT